jgi:hypothetical protein
MHPIVLVYLTRLLAFLTLFISVSRVQVLHRSVPDAIWKLQACSRLLERRVKAFTATSIHPSALFAWIGRPYHLLAQRHLLAQSMPEPNLSNL